MEPVKELLVSVSLVGINEVHKISSNSCIRLGTDNVTEWKALDILLNLAMEKNISKIQILGDSKLVIDWVNGFIGMHNLVLRPLFEIP